MTKVKTPLLSLGAIRKLGSALTFRRSRGQNIAEKPPIPTDAKSLLQLSWRHMYQKATVLWHALSSAEKETWESQARRRHMTGYAWFMSQALKPNPGLYLPLQGGIMSGDIDMDSNKIENLPNPTLAQDAATKAYIDDLAFSGNVILYPMNYNTIVQGAWSLTPVDVAWGSNLFRNATANDGDAITINASLPKGTYTIRVMYTKANSCGICDIDIDGDEVMSFDTYAAITAKNIFTTETPVVIAASGLKIITMRADGKNGLSSAFTINVTMIALWRIA